MKFKFTRFFVYIIISFFTIFSLNLTSQTAYAVVNGTELQSSNSFLVGLHNTNFFELAISQGKDPYWATHFCGGVLISDKHVLTAAHCLHSENSIKNPEDLGVGFGSVSLAVDSDYKMYDVKNIHVHPRYNSENNLNDIAIIILKDPIYSEKYAVLPTISDLRLYNENRWAEVLGWGEITQFWRSTTGLPDFPVNTHSGLVQISESKLCGISLDAAKDSIFYDLHVSPIVIEEELVKDFRSATVCALGYSSTVNDFIDSCQGDSGGPLVDVATNKVIGLVSWGFSCAGSYPGVYTKLISYIDFIQEYTLVKS